MNVKVFSSSKEINEVAKEYAKEKAMKLARYFDGVNAIDVTLNIEGDVYSTEVVASATKGNKFIGRSKDKNICAAVDTSIDKIENQLRKFKEKLKGKKRRSEKTTVILKGTEYEKTSLKGDGLADLWW